MSGLEWPDRYAVATLLRIFFFMAAAMELKQSRCIGYAQLSLLL
jgi:hypothetical protein